MDRLEPQIKSGARGQIIVHVAGAVNYPGIIALPFGSRVYDAIQDAGGPSGDANLDQVNLAAKLTDGIQVYVPHRGYSPNPAQETPSGPLHSRRTKQPSGLVDINSADVAQLTTLPGIGASLAQRIIDYRNEHGTFRAVDDLLGVQGLGQRRLDQIRPWLAAN